MTKTVETNTEATFTEGSLKLTQTVKTTRSYLWGLIVLTTWHKEPVPYRKSVQHLSGAELDAQVAWINAR